MSERIRGFDGLRGLSVIAVVLTHLHVFEFAQAKGWLSPAVIPLINGSTGVLVFFVLSGFLITHLLISEVERSGTISLRNFYIRRTLRIMPLYLVFLLSATAIYWLDPKTSTPTSLMYAWLYAYNFIPQEHYTSFIGHTWSLAVEEHFYLLWPFLFLFLYPLHRRLMLTLLLLTIPVSTILGFMLIKASYGSSHFVMRWSFVAGSAIAVGCIGALAWAQPRVRRMAEIKSSAWILGSAIVIYTVPAIAFGRSWTFDNLVAGHMRAIAVVILVLWIMGHQRSILVKWLETAPLRYIGLISYGVYMYQGLFLATGPVRVPGHLWPPPDQLIGLLLLIAVAPASFHLFEKPLTKLGERFRSAGAHRFILSETMGDGRSPEAPPVESR